MSKYSIIHRDHTSDIYAESDVPGEFRRFTNGLGSEQLSITLIQIPPHSDFEQGTGHSHAEIEELYIIVKGTLTMRFDEDIVKVSEGSVVRVSPNVVRSHRNEGDEPVEMWAISCKIDYDDSKLIREFWSPSDKAAQKKQ